MLQVRLFLFIVIIKSKSVLLLSGQTINWQPGNWASACEFRGNDLTSATVLSKDCGGLCYRTQNCTHFTWSSGTCLMKKGPISKDKAIASADKTKNCGIVGNATAPGNQFHS